MNSLWDIINVPFGLLLKLLYNLCGNYAIALLLFTLVVQIALLPFGIKQQKNQIRMAQIKPKEQAIRKKYSGRTDTATQQKLNTELMEMYKSENYSPMSGCWPLLVQLPIIIALYNIIRQPLTYIAQFPKDLLKQISQFIVDNNLTDKVITADNLAKDELSIVNIFADKLDFIKSGIENAPELNNFTNFDFNFFGQSLIVSPAEAGILTVLILIPLLNGVTTFLTSRISRKLNSKAMANPEAANNTSMKIMEYTMPLMILYMAYTMPSALGLYWLYRSIAAVGQMLILSRVFPIPEISEEEYKLAEQKYGTIKKKKKKKIIEIEVDDDEDENGETVETQKPLLDMAEIKEDIKDDEK